MEKQRGLSLSGLLLVCVLIIAVALVGFKLFPAYAEYLKVKNAVTEIGRSSELKGSPKEMQLAFERRAAIDSISVIGSKDLEFTKQADGYAVTAAWSVKVPLFGNLSACMDFEAHSK